MFSENGPVSCCPLCVRLATPDQGSVIADLTSDSTILAHNQGRAVSVPIPLKLENDRAGTEASLITVYVSPTSWKSKKPDTFPRRAFSYSYGMLKFIVVKNPDLLGRCFEEDVSREPSLFYSGHLGIAVAELQSCFVLDARCR